MFLGHILDKPRNAAASFSQPSDNFIQPVARFGREIDGFSVGDFRWIEEVVFVIFERCFALFLTDAFGGNCLSFRNFFCRFGRLAWLGWLAVYFLVIML